jgi:hypothetical protein
MKKIILTLILFAISCVGGTNKEEAPARDSVPAATIDSIQFITKSIDLPLLEAPETISVSEDTNIKKKAVEKRAMDISKLDTTSFIPELKANVEKINYQQKQLDSLLTKKKK